MKAEYIESAEVSDVGRKRKNNEDACLRIPEKGIYCVADGMGGQAGGDLASETIITTLEEVFGKAAPEEAGTLARRIALFSRGVDHASKWIKNFSEEKVLGQMGSTVVALVFDPRDPSRAMGLHAGDSRLYRHRGGELKQLTADHSAVAALAAKLGRDPESLPAKYQNELLRCVGMTETVELEKTPVDVRSGDVFLLCSDGLTKMMPDKAIAAVLQRGADSPIGSVAQTLIDGANEAGGRDNVTVVLMKVGDISAGHADVPDEEETRIFETAVPPAAVASVAETDAGERSTAPETLDAPRMEDATRATDDPFSPPPSPVGIPAPAPRSAPPGGKVKGRAKARLGVAAGIAAVFIFGGWLAFRPRPKPAALVSYPAPPPVALPPEKPIAEAPRPAAIFPPKPAAAPIAITLSPPPPSAGTEARIRDQRAAEQAEKVREEALRIQSAFRQAMSAAQRNLGEHDYAGAASAAEQALLDAPGDSGAMKLREDALRAEAAEESDRKYESAVKAARNAMNGGDYATASAKAREALAIRPGDQTASQLADQSREPLDLEAARAAFAQGDYAAVAKLSESHPGADAFAPLAKAGLEEQSALADAREHFDRGDYSYAVELKRLPYAHKPPFADVIGQAEKEWKVLGDLASLDGPGDWRTVLARLDDPASAAFANKPPFRELAARASAQRQLADLNGEFETMLVQFGAVDPTDPYLQTTEGRRARRIEGALSAARRDNYLQAVDRLERGYSQGGWLDDNDREKYIRKLRDAIARHD